MRKTERRFLVKTLIEAALPAIFALLLLSRPYPPWITGLFGLNSTFFSIGSAAAESRGTEYPVRIYAEKENPGTKRLLAGPFREFPQCRYLLLTPEALFWFDDSGENCAFSPERISVKKNALAGAAEVSEPFKNICSSYRIERRNGSLVYSLCADDRTLIVRFFRSGRPLSDPGNTGTFLLIAGSGNAHV